MLEALALISVSDADSQCNTPGPIFLILGRSILGMAVGTLGKLTLPYQHATTSNC
jgi:hypothetical protein